MPSRKPDRSMATSLAMALLARLGACREQLKVAAEQLRQSPDDNDASRVAQETIHFLTDWLKTFQVTHAALSDRGARRAGSTPSPSGRCAPPRAATELRSNPAPALDASPLPRNEPRAFVLSLAQE